VFHSKRIGSIVIWHFGFRRTVAALFYLQSCFTSVGEVLLLDLLPKT